MNLTYHVHLEHDKAQQSPKDLAALVPIFNSELTDAPLVANRTIDRTLFCFHFVTRGLVQRLLKQS